MNARLWYHDPLRRRARGARRVVAGSLRSPMMRGGVVAPAFWWDGHPNFGDALTPWLLPRYGILPVHRTASRARLVGVGSVLEFLPREFDGAIWGSGLIRGESYPLPRARVLAVRGELTRALIGADSRAALGDPGLLVSRWLRRPRRRWDVALVPHGHHRSHTAFLAMAASAQRSVLVVDVHQGAASAVRQIAAADVVITTSLHGLVTADSFGIPAVWTTLEPPLDGGDFKFRDYESAITPGRTRFASFHDGTQLSELVESAWSAAPARVAQLSDGLERALVTYQQSAPPEDRFPGGLLRALRNR
jgi:hypothetical protein